MGVGFVDLEKVSLRYGSGDTLALAEANMKIRRDEFIAVVGPSGCGKSTLLKLVSGLTPPTSGNVIVDDKEVSGPLKIVGMAFQNPTLLPWRTTIDNVLLPLEIVEPYRRTFRRDRAKHVERAMAMLKTVGLDGFERKYPWQLSGGMQQRVSICRALIHEPSLLMLDEPFAALDAFTREELWGILQDLWIFRPSTVMLVTHDLREAAFLADTIYVMSKRPGRILHLHNNTLPRPRTLETTFSDTFTGMVHELRGQIAAVRAA